MSGLCWCGLPAELHDGREMDAAGEMHRFNEVARGTGELPEFEEDRPCLKGAPAPRLPETREALAAVFLRAEAQSEGAGTKAERREALAVEEMRQMLPVVISHGAAKKAIPQSYVGRLRNLKLLVDGL